MYSYDNKLPWTGHIWHLCIYLCPFLKFYILNVVNSLSHWTPNGEIFDIHKSSVSPKDPLTNLYKSGAYIMDFMV